MAEKGPTPAFKSQMGKGRPKGVPNKVTADIKALAGAHTAKALEVLASIMVNGEAEASRVAAARELLDRAHGKPSQTLAGDPAAPLVIQEIVRRIVRAGN